MKAQLIYGAYDLRYEEIPTPECPKDGILVKTIACGVCGSDMRTYSGGTKGAILPSVNGHEIAAQIIESNMEDWPVGANLSIACTVACGKCWYCKNGIQNQCDNMQSIGTANGVQGGFAEYIAFTGYQVENGCFNIIPEGIDPIGTVLAETASSVLGAQMNTNMVMEDLVLIVGCGAIGTLHGEIAKIRGAKEIIIAEMNPEKAELARSRGFDNIYTFASGDQGLYDLVMEKSNGRGADTVICANPNGIVQADALKLARKRGKVIFFGGIDPKTAQVLDTNLIHYKEITVHGANAYSAETNRKALNLILSGQLDPKRWITHKYDLKDLEQAFADMKAGKTMKAVIVF